MTKLPKQITDRIEREEERGFIEDRKRLQGDLTETALQLFYRMGYSRAATSEAERAMGLVDAVAKESNEIGFVLVEYANNQPWTAEELANVLERRFKALKAALAAYLGEEEKK